MVFFNYSTMQMAAKVVYYGPGLCGKTTNLHFIYGHTTSDSRGEMVSLETETDRTLFFDLLPIDVGSIAGFNTRIQLYTVPGQVFYNTTRKLVLKGVDGVVFVADSQRPMLQANIDSFRNLEENLAEMGLSVDTLPIVLQFNKRDLPDILSIDEMNAALNRAQWPHVEACAVSGPGVFETLKEISRVTLLSLKKRLARPDAPAQPPRPPGPPPRPPGQPAPGTISGVTPLPTLSTPPPIPILPSRPLSGAYPTVPAGSAGLPGPPPQPTGAHPLPPGIPTTPPTPPTLPGQAPRPVSAAHPVQPAPMAPMPPMPPMPPIPPSAPPVQPVPQTPRPQSGAYPTTGQSGAFPVFPDIPAAPAGPSGPAMSTGIFQLQEAPTPPPRLTTPAAPPPPPRPAARKGSLDVLGELEKLRQQTRPAQHQTGPVPIPPQARPAGTNGRHEMSRNVEMNLRRSDLQRARRVLISFQVEDDQQRVMDTVRETVDIQDASSLEKLLLRLNVALNTKE